MDKYTGKRLDGRYEIHEIIGVGGMAVVYRAYDRIDKRTVAVKILKEEFLGNEEFIRRFKNESKAIAMLSHPNIVKVYDVSFGDRIQYIVEEYIDGITLKEYLDQQKKIKWKEAIYFTAQILHALQHAHEKGIVHRDIKPQNIMLLQDGTIKVTDFGIARFSRSETRTMTSRAIGSVHYIAPEQARGDLTDEKTDIYSVGVMLYEMLTGRLPFEADSAVSVAIMQLQNEPKPLRDINPSIPEGLEEITLKAMRKDPKQRYQSAAEMLDDIEAFKKNPGMKFGYKYFVDEKPTRYVDSIDDLKNGGRPYYNDNYEYLEEPEDAPKKKKKPVAVLIVAGIAAAFLIAAVIFSVMALVKSFNSGSSEVVLDSFVGKNYTDVVNNSSYKSFTFKKEEKSDSTHAAGVIISQNPKAGITVKSNSTVTLTVSTGGQSVEMPDLTGKTKDEADELLKNAGLTNYTFYNAESDSVDKGKVIYTDPTTGTQVKIGDTTEIKIYISTGKEEEKVAVPDVVGKTLDEAEKEIKAVGLTVGNVEQVDDSSKAKNTVLSVDPLNGVKLEKNAPVNLSVSSGNASKKTITVNVNLPQNVKHDIQLKAYFDGDLTSNKTVNSQYNDICTLEFTGTTGQHTVVVTLDGSEYNVFTLNFDTKKGGLTQSSPYVDPSSSGNSSQGSTSSTTQAQNITPGN